MLTIETSISNTRPVKEEKGAVIEAKPTKGQVFISAATAQKLGVGSGDYINVVVANGGQVYVMKGQNEKGKEGLKLAPSSYGLSFSGANVWKTLKGSTNFTRTFEINEEGVSHTLANGEEVTAFAVSSDYTEVAKQERKSASKSDVAVESSPVEGETYSTPIEDEENDTFEL